VDLNVAVLKAANCEKVAAVPFLVAVARQHESKDEFNSQNFV
jgi:F0F1-type ATP synthase membrane subunit c/vacuolar-type H+-ATPase subunit K